jgi:hypothetical protein
MAIFLAKKRKRQEIFLPFFINICLFLKNILDNSEFVFMKFMPEILKKKDVFFYAKKRINSFIPL